MSKTNPLVVSGLAGGVFFLVGGLTALVFGLDHFLGLSALLLALFGMAVMLVTVSDKTHPTLRESVFSRKDILGLLQATILLTWLLHPQLPAWVIPIMIVLMAFVWFFGNILMWCLIASATVFKNCIVQTLGDSDAQQ